MNNGRSNNNADVDDDNNRSCSNGSFGENDHNSELYLSSHRKLSLTLRNILEKNMIKKQLLRPKWQ